MSAPRLLDLFCGAGGAAMGYHRAGFEVVGVDIKPQPHYPFTFVQADALEYVAEHGREFDAIHASPPCQAYSALRSLHPLTHAALVPETLAALRATGLPWVVENVPGAPLPDPLILCGSMMGLGAQCHDSTYRQLRRHRLFTSSVLIFAPGFCNHVGQPVGVYGHGGGGQMTRGYKGTRAEYDEALGIDWATKAEMAQAIPPAYTEWIGRQLMAALESAA